MVIFVCVEYAYVLYNQLNAIDFVNCKNNSTRSRSIS